VAPVQKAGIKEPRYSGSNDILQEKEVPKEPASASYRSVQANKIGELSKAL
jgi:hypothetical protein